MASSMTADYGTAALHAVAAVLAIDDIAVPRFPRATKKMP